MSRGSLGRRVPVTLLGGVRSLGLGLLVAVLGAASASALGGQAPVEGTEREGPGPDAPSRQEPVSKRFEEQVEVVAPGRAPATAPSELPVRPLAVMAVAGAADNVFRTLQTLPGIAATSEFDSRLSVRGGSPDENLTVVDGVEVHNPYRLFGLTSAFNPETVSSFDLYAGAFSARYGDRLSSLLVVENRPGSAEKRLSGSTTLALTDANVLLEGALPGRDTGSWLVTARRTYYDLLANRIVGTELPAFSDLQGRVDWALGSATRLSLFGLLSREATDASLTGDRPGEQADLVTGARNDLAALQLTRLIGARASSRTVVSFYSNRDEIDAAAQFRDEARRSNAPSDDVGFRASDVDFTRGLELRDLALRQELAVAAERHLVEAGFEAHGLRTRTVWQIEGQRNPSAANGSSVRGGAGLPSELDSAVGSTRAGAWLQDRWSAARRLTLEAGLRLDWSGVNRRATLSPRLSAAFQLDGATRLRLAGGLYTQSPGYEKLAQADYFVDLSGELGRSLSYERALQAVVGLERDLGAGLGVRVEGYWKQFDDLIVGRLETEPERLARVALYDFPRELASSVPREAIVTSVPVNGGRGRAYGVEILLQKRASAAARLSGWASYTLGRAYRDEYGRRLPFDYDRTHAATLVAAWRIGPRFELGATLRAFSGFPLTPVLGLRVAADPTEDGRYVPALDAEGRFVYEPDRGGVANLNAGRLPAFFRLDLRLAWTPGGREGRWQLYLDVINATNRENAGQLDPRLAYDAASSLDRPRLSLEPAQGVPLLPSVGVRFRF